MFQVLFFNPLFNALIFFYNTIAFQDLGISIILLTLGIRIIFAPLFYKSMKNQSIIQRLQPEINKIQHDHKDNKEKQAQAIMGLYRRHNVNPFSGFLMLLIQLPVLIALYQVVLKEFSPEIFANLYAFVAKPEHINPYFLGLIDLEKRSILMVGLAAIAQYLQGYLAFPKTKNGQVLSPAEKVGRQMIYLGPLLSVMILVNLPSAIGIYWVATSLFTVAQQIYINKTINFQEEKKEHGLVKTKT